MQDSVCLYSYPSFYNSCMFNSYVDVVIASIFSHRIKASKSHTFLNNYVLIRPRHHILINCMGSADVYMCPGSAGVCLLPDYVMCVCVRVLIIIVFQCPGSADV